MAAINPRQTQIHSDLCVLCASLCPFLTTLFDLEGAGETVYFQRFMRNKVAFRTGNLGWPESSP